MFRRERLVLHWSTYFPKCFVYVAFRLAYDIEGIFGKTKQIINKSQSYIKAKYA